MRNIAFISLGCDKNRVDTEHIISNMLHGDYSVSSPEEADVIVINTCAFIESARQESIDTILDAARYKNDRCKKLVVAGCLAQKYLTELKENLPEVDAFVGVFDYDNILTVIDGLFGETPSEVKTGGRILTTFPSSVYLRIADGCNNYCTFCTIPSIRGKYKSVPMEEVVEEAKSFIDESTSELILIAQDITRYGTDIYGKPALKDLLIELCKTDVKRIRLMYCYPEMITDDLIDLIASEDKICKYIDVPIQHISPRILKLMNRKGTAEQIKDLFDKLNSRGIVIRTTLMVGFPSETQEEFDELCDFVREYKPTYAGVFAYSKEEDTPSAKLKGHITKKEKLRRVNVLGSICAEVTEEFNKSLIGKTIRVLYEDIDFDKNLFVGRADFQSPDIDGKVYFTSKNTVNAGQYYDVKITSCDTYDLYGEEYDQSSD